MSAGPDDNIARSECGRVHGPNWIRWLGHLRGTPCAGMEIGTFRGESAEWFLDNICTHADSRFYCIDPFTGSDEHRIGGVDCSRLREETVGRLRRFSPRHVIVELPSERALPGMMQGGQSMDFAYVDGDHHARSVLRDSVLAWEMLRAGGVMIWDDYGWTVMPRDLDRPQMAIDRFLDCYADQCRVMERTGWQVAARKLA